MLITVSKELLSKGSSSALSCWIFKSILFNSAFCFAFFNNTPSGSTAKMPGNPIKLESYEENYSPAPELGEHTAEVLEKYLKISSEELDSLKADKII